MFKIVNFWLGELLQTSEVVARVPHLFVPAPSGALVDPDLPSY